MIIDGVVTVAQCSEAPPFDSFFEPRFQSFCVCEEVECLDVFGFLLQFRFGKVFGLAR